MSKVALAGLATDASAATEVGASQSNYSIWAKCPADSTTRCAGPVKSTATQLRVEDLLLK